MPSSILTKKEVPALIEMLYTAPKDLLKSHIVNGKTRDDLENVIASRTFSKLKLSEILPYLDEELREYLPLRSDTTFVVKTKHKR
jgi:hypothetical protein